MNNATTTEGMTMTHTATLTGAPWGDTTVEVDMNSKTLIEGAESVAVRQIGGCWGHVELSDLSGIKAAPSISLAGREHRIANMGLCR